MHRVILSSLRKICDKQSDWPDYIPGLLLSLHSSVVTSLGLTPAFALYHRELRIPIMATLPVSTENMDKTLSHVLETTRVTDQLIEDNTQESFSRADKSYNKTAEVRQYKRGDKVLSYDEHVAVGTMRKLNIFYRPVIILDVLPHNCYKLQDVGSGRPLPFKVHVSRLKSMRKDSPAQPANQETVTPPEQTKQGPRDPVKRPAQQRQPRNKAADNTWYTITGIKARRRQADGCYLYLVEYAEDRSTAWLPAKAISPDVVRSYNARRRRRH